MSLSFEGLMPLKVHGVVDTVVLTGIYMNICVKHTAADAFNRGYDIVVLRDYVRIFRVVDHEHGLKYMEKIYGAKIMTADEFLENIVKV